MEVGRCITLAARGCNTVLAVAALVAAAANTAVSLHGRAETTHIRYAAVVILC
jgi:hypothetical protein